MRTRREFDARRELETSAALTVPLASMSKMPPPGTCAPTINYPYNTRGRIVTIPGQIVSSSTKPIMIIR